VTNSAVAPTTLSNHRSTQGKTDTRPRDSWRIRLTPLLAFFQFEVGRLLRSWKFLAITIGFPVIFYILFLGDQTAGKVVDGTVPWRVYLMVSMCSFGALVAALNAGGTRLSMEQPLDGPVSCVSRRFRRGRTSPPRSLPACLWCSP